MEQRGAPAARDDVIRLGRLRMGLAYFASAFGFAAMVMPGFLVPLRAQELGAPLAIIGLVVGAGSVLPAFLSVSAGALSDRLGPRRVYMYSALVAGVAALLSALTTSYWMLGVLQLAAGLAASFVWLASQAYLASIGRPDQLAAIMGKMSFATNAGMVVSPVLIGASAELIGYQWSFAVIAAIAFLFALVGWILPEVRVRGRASASATGISTAMRLMRLRGIQVLMILTLVRVGSVAAWMAFYPLLLVERGFSPTAAGTVIAAHALVATFVTLGAARVAALMGNVPAVIAGLGIGAAGIALSPLMAFPWIVYLPAILVGIGQGISLPLLIATVSEEAPPEERGVALGIRQMVNQFGMALAPMTLGVLGASMGLVPGFILTAFVSGGLLGAGAWMHRPRARLANRRP